LAFNKISRECNQKIRASDKCLRSIDDQKWEFDFDDDKMKFKYEKGSW